MKSGSTRLPSGLALLVQFRGRKALRLAECLSTSSVTLLETTKRVRLANCAFFSFHWKPSVLLEREIALTVPINTYVQQRENDVTYYETCLVLPSKARSNPPKPNNPSVFLEHKPEMVVLTRYIAK